MPRTPPPDEIRLKALGLTRLRPGEATYTPRVRCDAAILERFKALTAQERGDVVKAGFEALGWGGEQKGEKAWRQCGNTARGIRK